MSQPERTEIKCSDCGKTATVPFKPTAGKPVYCRECLAKHRSPGLGEQQKAMIQNRVPRSKRGPADEKNGNKNRYSMSLLFLRSVNVKNAGLLWKRLMWG